VNSVTRIATLKSGADDRFSIKLTGLKPGDRLTATVSTPNFGTSEMPRPVMVKALPDYQVVPPAPVSPPVVEEPSIPIVIPPPVRVPTPPPVRPPVQPQLW
jgi:hypothetical protein